jgi:hypothetical protein
MRRSGTQGGGIFVLTVEGVLGPVLREALEPGNVDPPRTCTTIRAVAMTDLPGLVQLLDAHGLSIESVTRLPIEPDRRSRGPVG